MFVLPHVPGTTLVDTIVTACDRLVLQLRRLHFLVVRRYGPILNLSISAQLLLKYLCRVKNDLSDLRMTANTFTMRRTVLAHIRNGPPSLVKIRSEATDFVFENIRLTKEALSFRLEEAEKEYIATVPRWKRVKRREWPMNPEETDAFVKMAEGYVPMIEALRSLVFM
jgi:hypothetical protein